MSQGVEGVLLCLSKMVSTGTFSIALKAVGNSSKYMSSKYIIPQKYAKNILNKKIRFAKNSFTRFNITVGLRLSQIA